MPDVIDSVVSASTLKYKIAALALIVGLGFGGGVYLMWGEVVEARKVADEARTEAQALGKQFEDLAARQAASDALLASRKRQDNALSQQLEKLRSDLEGALKDDPASAAWGPDCIPAAVADRLRLPPDKDCDPP